MKVETKSKSTRICEETSLIVREKLTIQRKNSLNSSARWLRNSHNLSGLVRKWPSVSVTPVALEKVESLLVANMLKDAGLLETGNFVAKACLEFLHRYHWYHRYHRTRRSHRRLAATGVSEPAVPM